MRDPRSDTGGVPGRAFARAVGKGPPRSHRFIIRRTARRSQAGACPESGDRRKGVPWSESCARCLSPACHSVASSRMRRPILRRDADAAGLVFPSRCQRKGKPPSLRPSSMKVRGWCKVNRMTLPNPRLQSLTDFFSNPKPRSAPSSSSTVAGVGASLTALGRAIRSTNLQEIGAYYDSQAHRSKYHRHSCCRCRKLLPRCPWAGGGHGPGVDRDVCLQWSCSTPD